MAPIVMVILVAFLGLCWLLFGRQLTHNEEAARAVMDLSPAAAITNVRMLRRCLLVLVAVIIGFSLHSWLHIEPSMIALFGAGAMVLASGASPREFLSEVEWPTLVFFMGLFILVGGLVRVGLIGRLGTAAVEAAGDRYFLAATSLLFGSAVLGAFVDNVPYTAAMAPVVAQLVSSAPASQESSALWWAFALGADLGGNTTAVAAAANVVIIGIAASNGHNISFWQFTKDGLIVTVFTLMLAWPYIWLRYYAFA
jgi:Na+/H+ antiporter NhaD/arsenite permease-like protein